MKSLSLLIIFLVFSQLAINLSMTIARSKRSKAKTRAKALKDHVLYQLFTGILLGVSNIEEKDMANINKCIPKDWEVATKAPAENEEEKQPAEDKSEWKKFFEKFKEIVKLLCKFKDQAKGLLVGKIRRNMVKNFIQSSSMSRYKKKIDILKKGGNIVKELVKDTKNLMSKTFEEIKSQFSKIIEVATQFFKRIQARITSFLNSDFVAKIKEIVDCVIKAKDIVQGVIDVVKGAIARASEIATIAAGNFAALAKLLIDLVCNFEIFEQAWNFLIEAINEKGDRPKRWHLVGKFVGRLTKAITTKMMKAALR